MRVLARPLTRALAASLALGASLAISIPASAIGDIPSMYFSVTYAATYHKVCGVGAVRGTPAASPQWQLIAFGGRSDGTLISAAASATGQSAVPCLTITKGAPEGTYAVVFTFRDAVVDPDGPGPFAIAGHGIWRPGDTGSFAGIATP